MNSILKQHLLTQTPKKHVILYKLNHSNIIP